MTNKYVLWINGYDNASGYHVFNSSTPQGPFVEIAAPTLGNMGAITGGFVNGDFDIFKDSDGTAYIVYTNILTRVDKITHMLKIQKLNSSYTSGVGDVNIAVPGGFVEAPSLFRQGNTYYLMYGPLCPYCGGAPTWYKKLSTPMGDWATATQYQINGNSCGGQPSFVSEIPGDSGNIYIYGSDLWNNSANNEALANYYWQPLSFSNGNISPFNCSSKVSASLKDGSPGQSIYPTGVDQSSGIDSFRTWCDISSGLNRLQTFTTGKTGTLKEVGFTSFQKKYPNSGLRLDLVTVDSNNQPIGSSLFSHVFPSTAVGWSPRNLKIWPNLPVVAGNRYAIVASSETNNGGCYGFVFNDNKPYQSGSEAYGKYVPIAPNSPIGFLDMIGTNGMATGWALDKDNSSQSIAVHFYLDGPAGSGSLIGSTTANQPRPDINNLGYPGNHGYSFTIPNQYWDGKQHSLYAYGINIDYSSGSNIELSASPKTFQFAPQASCIRSYAVSSTIVQPPTVPLSQRYEDVFASGVQNVSAVKFPTWSNINGQDDIVWYEGINQGGGIWKATVDTNNHSGSGLINTHVYLVNSSNSYIFCGTANFYKN